MTKCVYAHNLRGEDRPFFIGSGSIARAHMLDRRPSRWQSYIGGRIGEVVVTIVERHDCEGRARMRECILIGEANPPGNYIAATRRAEDMLTGRAKGGADCGCGQPDCWQAEWDAMPDADRQRLTGLHNALVARNKAAPARSAATAPISIPVTPVATPARTPRPSRIPQRSTGRRKPLVPGDPITPRGTLYCLKCGAEHPHEHFRGGVGYRYKAQGDLSYQKWCASCLRKHSRRR